MMTTSRLPCCVPFCRLTPHAIRLAVQFGLVSFSLWVLLTVVAAAR
jgi:hypothetical protein